MKQTEVPYFRPELGEEEIEEVVDTLRSGWLTSGPKVSRFEEEFARAVRSTYAVAVNSCTAALHLAAEALGLKAGQGVLVPTMTFAATAEVVRYIGAVPILVDCDPATGNMDLEDAARKLDDAGRGGLNGAVPTGTTVVGMIPVHVGGLMMDIDAVQSFSARYGLWVIEDAAHAFPAAWRRGGEEPWQFCGEGTAAVTCFSFYANKTITTGEGGMVVTDDPGLAERMRLMSLHGLSHDAWKRYSNNGNWDYDIVAPGYKYNLTDLAAAIGIHQLARAEEMRRRRESIAHQYLEALAGIEEIEPPCEVENRVHARHLFPIRLHLGRLKIDRNEFIRQLKQVGIGCSVHWRPLHMHSYYREKFGWLPEDFPIATSLWERLISLPLFPGMRDEEIDRVVSVITDLCRQYAC